MGAGQQRASAFVRLALRERTAGKLPARMPSPRRPTRRKTTVTMSQDPPDRRGISVAARLES